jgi:outer membrane lipoprotein LolB
VRASVIGTTGKENFKVRFLWEQSADEYEIQLFDPLGRVVAKITGSDARVEVRTSKGEHYVDHDAQALIKRLFQLELPVNGLRYWALGIPHSGNADAMVDVDERGLATRIVDSGWHIEYSDYRLHEGEALPQKFQLSYATTELKVSVGSWELL